MFDRLEKPNHRNAAFVENLITHGMWTKRNGLPLVVQQLSGNPNAVMMEPMDDLKPELLAWTALLGRWLDLVKAGSGIHPDGEGPAWEGSLEPIITIQATAFALKDLASLEDIDRPLARDRAIILLEKSADTLETCWQGEIPDEIQEMLDDAWDALGAAHYAGLKWLVWPGPGLWEVPEMKTPVLGGTLAMMQPGTLVLPGEPVAWFTERPTPIPTDDLDVVDGMPVQVQRIIEDEVWLKDLVTDLDDELVGLPMLVPMSLAGEPIGSFTLDREHWLAIQHDALSTSAPQLETTITSD